MIMRGIRNVESIGSLTEAFIWTHLSIILTEAVDGFHKTLPYSRFSRTSIESTDYLHI